MQSACKTVFLIDVCFLIFECLLLHCVFHRLLFACLFIFTVCCLCLSSVRSRAFVMLLIKANLLTLLRQRVYNVYRSIVNVRCSTCPTLAAVINAKRFVCAVDDPEAACSPQVANSPLVSK